MLSRAEAKRGRDFLEFAEWVKLVLPGPLLEYLQLEFKSESFPIATILFVIGQLTFTIFHLSISMENEEWKMDNDK